MRCHDFNVDSLLLADEESPLNREFTLHAADCPQCQQKLIEISGEHPFLDEIRDLFRAGYEMESYEGNGPPTISVLIDQDFQEEGTVDGEPLSLDFLSPATHPELLGRIGRYDVEKVIGAGGMGIVLKGFDTELHRVVAIKVLKPHLAHHGAARHRFAREAKSAAAVVHEHVIPIYDVCSEHKFPYLVMKYVPGQSLQSRVDERGPLATKELLRIAVQVASGLAAAHSQGLVHRDVKPANILLEESVERVLISDFGLARAVDDASLTRTGIVAGTPHYMSPEQSRGLPVDLRSDLFSLGSVIYFMCTGRPPFRAENTLAVLNRICLDEHRPVDEINPDIPAEIAEFVDRLLAKNPADRCQTAHQVQQQFASILSRIQDGRRNRRSALSRRWHRRIMSVRQGLKRAAAGITFALLGATIMGGVWVTESLRTHRETSLRTFAEAAGTQAAEQTPQVNTEHPLPDIDQRSNRPFDSDRFDAEVLNLQQILNNWEQVELDRSGNHQVPDFNDEWKNELNDLRGALEVIEHRSPPLVPSRDNLPSPSVEKE